MGNTNATEVTISDIRAYKSCRTYWDFSSTLRRGLAKKFRGFHFIFGDLVHRALDQYYQGNAPDIFFEGEANKLLKTIPVDAQGLDKIIDLVEAGPKLLRLYAKFAKNYDDFEVLRSEERHVLKLNSTTPGTYFTFKFDALVLRDGKYWLMEFKTTSQLPNNLDMLVIDDQAVAYQAATEKVLGLPIEGVIYTFLRKKNPTEPEQLKNGSFSQRANLVTTGEQYLETLRNSGVNVDSWLADEANKEFFSSVCRNEFNHFIFRGTVRANSAQKASKLEEIAHIAEEMGKQQRIYPSPEKIKCSVCDFFSPCLSQQAGMNFEAVLAQDYELAEARL